MSRSTGLCIADSLQLCLGYAERLLTDVTPEMFARYANVNGQMIESNHPAFVYGHLSIYPERIVSQLGHDASAVAPSERFQELFNPSAKCQDDPDGTLYPSMEEITSTFTRNYNAALEVLKSADDAAFQGENPHEGRLRELFPSIGSMHAFYAGGHVMMHLGQVSAWRRMMGLGPA